MKSKDNKINYNILLFVEIIIIEYLCIPLFKFDMEVFQMFLFGSIFFFSGLFVSMQAKYFGLIFLFSHGVTGLGIMLGFMLLNDKSKLILSDVSSNKMSFLKYGEVIIIIGIILSIIYNLNDNWKKKEYIKPAILGVFMLGIYSIAYVLGLVF